MLSSSWYVTVPQVTSPFVAVVCLVVLACHPRPPMRPLRTFLFEGGHEVSQVHFGCRAPVSLVAASKEGLICVWALHGFLLATFQFSQACLSKQMR